MKKTLFCLLTCCAALVARADELTWLTSLPGAQAQAKKENKLVFIDVTGSDWCPTCRELEEDVLQKPQFIDFAKTNLVPVRVDFPIAIKQSPELEAANQAITNKFGVIGFPTLLVLSPEGKLLWKQLGYLDGGPHAMIAKLKQVKKNQ